jgi:hypothetical protein
MSRATNKPIPSQEILRHHFDYDPLDGNLRWKNPTSKANTKIGDLAGTILNSGYRQIKLKRCVYLAHRLVWMWVYGEDPGEFEIDHIDRNKDNNRIENLRKVTRQGNARNLPSNSRSKLGVRGISKVGRRFIASVRHDGRDILKTFYSLEEAVSYKSEMEDLLWR